MTSPSYSILKGNLCLHGLIHTSSSNLFILVGYSNSDPFLLFVNESHKYSFFPLHPYFFVLLFRKKNLTSFIVISGLYSFIQKKIGVEDWIWLLHWCKSFEIIQICYTIKKKFVKKEKKVFIISYSTVFIFSIFHLLRHSCGTPPIRSHLNKDKTLRLGPDQPVLGQGIC